jgi:hypothetical protein
VAGLESAWAAIRAKHPDVPAVVLVVGSGSPARRTAPLRYGHFASLRWQAGDQVLPEVLVSGEGLKRTPTEVLTTLLHEAAHGLADRRGIRDTSRQGRWHNKHFAGLAAELGLDAVKDDRLGWSLCTIRPATTAGYAQVLDELGAVMRAWRHVDEPGSGSTTNKSNNGQSSACACARRIRVAISVADAGPILCGVCHTAFTAE